jgi:hypothetical protein
MPIFTVSALYEKQLRDNSVDKSLRMMTIYNAANEDEAVGIFLRTHADNMKDKTIVISPIVIRLHEKTSPSNDKIVYSSDFTLIPKQPEGVEL